MKKLSFLKTHLRSSFCPVLLTVTTALYVSLQMTVSAASIGVDFSGDGPNVDSWVLAPTDTAGVVAQANWNHVSTRGGGDDVSLARGTSGSLMDQAGNMTRVRLQFFGNDSWYIAGDPTSPNFKMMKGTLKQAGAPGPLVLSFTNLNSGTYDVYVYGNVDAGPVDADTSVGNQTNYWSQPGYFDDSIGFYEAVSPDPGARLEGNYVKFTGVPSVNGGITILTYYRGGGNGVGIAGVQLVTGTGSFPSFEGATAMGVQVQLTNTTVYVGSEASFNFVATNNAPEAVPVTYQWFKNDQLLPGVTGAQYTFLAGPSDNNARIYARATMPPAYNPLNIGVYSATGMVTTLPGIVATNGLKVEYFPGATREAVESGNVGRAASIFTAPGFELPVNDGVNNYTRRVSGYFIPQVTGPHVFFVSADDDADLFLSTSEDPAQKRLIAREENWSGSRDWTSSGGNSSVSQKRSDQFTPDGVNYPFASGIQLVAGQRYYIEGVQHQGAGGNNFAVTAKLLNDPDPVDDDAPTLHATNRNVAFITSPATTLAWSVQPTNITTAAAQPLNLVSRAVSDAEFAPVYQWYRNDAAIAGANAATYSFVPSLSDNAARYFVTAALAQGGLSITSSVATLTVTANDRMVLTFSDQVGNDVPAEPNPYTEAQGLPAGITATFEGFSNWRGSQDHTPTSDNYLLYGDQYEDGSISRLTFNVPVEVPSFWVATQGGGRPGVATLVGYLGQTEQFRMVLNNPGFEEVTLGAGKLVDHFEFIDYGDSWIDDMTIVKPAVLTFSNQIGNDVTANPSVYSEDHGLPAGVTATFSGFSNWRGSQDHTPTADNYLLYGDKYEPGSISTLTFNVPVSVPSIWVSTQGGGQPGKATIKGYLGTTEKFSYVVGGGGFVEMTAGAGQVIDSIRFIDYGDSWIDDLTVVKAAPQPPPPPPMITFANQVGNDVPANPSVYTDTHGLPAGITATFQGFSNWRGSQDHTPTGDNYLLYGDNYEPGGVSTLTFNQPVEVPSFWVSTQGGGDASKATIKAYLGNVEQFSLLVGGGGFKEVTAGAGKAIDSIRFIDYGDSWIDDIVVNAFTAPAQLSIGRNANSTLTLSWTGTGTLQQSSTLTGGWTAAPSQANPQTITPTGDRMFFRLQR